MEPLEAAPSPARAGDVHREQLVADHLELVEALARKVRTTISARIEQGDLVAYGRQGLVEAAQRFDPRHGASFKTFAYYRIRGAMYDGIRTMGWYSRADHARFRAEERTHEYLSSHAEAEAARKAAEASHGGGAGPADRDPTAQREATTAAALASIGEILIGIATVQVVTIDAAATVIDESAADAEASLVRAELTDRMRSALGRLPERERDLIERCYFGEQSLTDAGQALGLSKSWASRLHARAIDRLGQLMAIEAGAEPATSAP